MAAVMMHLNTRPRALATTTLLTTLTLGYIPDQGEEITITSGDPAISNGQLSPATPSCRWWLVRM